MAVTSGANAVSVAEHAMALLFAVAKQIVPLDAGLRAGRWDKPGFKRRELAGQSIGLFAFGAIARQTGAFAKAFGMEVLACDPFASDAQFAADGVMRVDTLDALCARCEVISLHAPLTPATRGIINAERIALMKPDAILINTARGALIDEDALCDALAAGHLAGAGLDTFAQEPPPADHRYFAEPRVVISPHIGGVTTAANTRVGVEAAQAIVDHLAGRGIAPSRIVNRAALAPHTITA
ncbi:NAD(P)-dependent oxidoreductase [Gemmobacter serpentinus]|uniref:NAD(P)-dependent oxidoreductase n=1 Tax=Gemmobacter serpentinus TaxID=2652247 RepID=UPI00186581B9|nr:NAD(P)-dependent oxidoreductase [Gemmobacter serpentinus]